MGKRNMMETAQKAKGNIPHEYSLTMSECRELTVMVHDGHLVSALLTAFRYGFVLGNRATASGKITTRI